MFPVWLILGALDGAILVVLGAAGSHGAIQDPELVRLFALAADYQGWHAVALLAIGLGGGRVEGGGRRLIHFAAAAFLVGTILFSGSLYVHAFTGVAPIPMAAPFGGGFLILGWLLLIATGVVLLRNRRD
jgi:uncharacterized membrane protein YgdD (TMEM256/DUF423 family)